MLNYVIVYVIVYVNYAFVTLKLDIPSISFSCNQQLHMLE